MKIRISPLVVVALLGVSQAWADEGLTRATNGATAAVTSPVKIVEGVQDETARNGPLAGAVVGTARGAVNAAGAAAEGGVNVGVGVFQATVGVVQQIFRPFTSQ